jgi:hypothetical protein
MNTPNPTDQREWWRENWQHSKSWSNCTRCGVKILRSHLAEGVCRDVAECDVTLARQPASEPVAAVRLEDGSQVVAHAPSGLEVQAFTREDLDEHGVPRWAR